MCNHMLRVHNLRLCHDTFVDNDTCCRLSFDTNRSGVYSDLVLTDHAQPSFHT